MPLKCLLKLMFFHSCNLILITLFNCNVCYIGQPFENAAIMNSAVGNIIVSIILGKRYQYEDPTFQRLISLVNENVRLAGSPPVLVNYFSILKGVHCMLTMLSLM